MSLLLLFACATRSVPAVSEPPPTAQSAEEISSMADAKAPAPMVVADKTVPEVANNAPMVAQRQEALMKPQEVPADVPVSGLIGTKGRGEGGIEGGQQGGVERVSVGGMRSGQGGGLAGGGAGYGSGLGGRGRINEEREERPIRTPEKKVDWGGTTFLSNDDSLSVASAQRLIWAVKRQSSVNPSQVRPHELLNYFSFATNTPEAGELFAVKASARRDGDHMSLALAVHGAQKKRRPLDLTLVVDRSGSMNAEGRMDYLKKALHRMERQLKAGDRVDLVSFDDQAEVMLSGFQVDGSTEALTTVIDQLRPRGSTNLDAGLKEAYRLARLHPASSARNRQVLLITDAELNSGNVNEDMVSQVGRAFEEDGIHLTGVGVGTSFNDRMLNKLTEKGRGAYVYLGSESVIERFFGSGFGTLVETLAEDVQFSLSLPPSLATERFYGEESSKVASDVQKINFNAGATQVFLQDLKINNPNDSDRISLRINYQLPGTSEKQDWTWNTSLGQLWATGSENADKAKALMSWSDLVLAQNGVGDCDSAREAWGSHPSDNELKWLDSISSHLCPSQSNTIAEME